MNSRTELGKSFIEVLKRLGNSADSVVRQQASKVKPISEEEARLAILTRIGEGTDLVRKGEGFSIDPRTGKLVTLGTQSGHFMSPIKNDVAVQLPWSENITQEDIMNAIPQEYWPRLQRGGYLGSWVDNGQIYLDPSERYISKLSSLKHGLKAEQLQGTQIKTPMPTNWETQKSPFYDVTPEEYQKELDRIKKIAITSMIGTTATGIPAALYINSRGE